MLHAQNRVESRPELAEFLGLVHDQHPPDDLNSLCAHHIEEAEDGQMGTSEVGTAGSVGQERSQAGGNLAG